MDDYWTVVLTVSGIVATALLARWNNTTHSRRFLLTSRIWAIKYKYLNGINFDFQKIRQMLESHYNVGKLSQELIRFDPSNTNDNSEYEWPSVKKQKDNCGKYGMFKGAILMICLNLGLDKECVETLDLDKVENMTNEEFSDWLKEQTKVFQNSISDRIAEQIYSTNDKTLEMALAIDNDDLMNKARKILSKCANTMTPGIDDGSRKQLINEIKNEIQEVTKISRETLKNTKDALNSGKISPEDLQKIFPNMPR